MRELPNPTFALSPLSLPRGLLHRPAESVQNINQGKLLPAERGTLVVSWARHQDEVRAVQRLRYRVFSDEMGARLSSNLPGHDI
ncbi:MAG TPA: ornithine-acyl-ACP acyltransferase, partial [Rhodoferax sp.]|nr:ornithine-acyl-ACP acyltransferase [Rhodoferax sp.]